MIRVHGTCVDVAGTGVLLRGPSGAGKSDLALRLIDDGARLVADDQVEITREGQGLRCRPPLSIAGLLEVRGVGIFRLDHAAAGLGLVVDLVAPDCIERLPDPQTVEIFGAILPLLALNPWEVSATAKVRLAVQAATGTIMSVQ
ncbi:MAG TPA: serine/threonine protein kinase [Patescibacteria group bacterium]|nr:serine/threonine protein kinase [Patescibacteria group bacterium]